MKKILCVIMLLAICMSICACDNTVSDVDSTNNQNKTQSSEEIKSGETDYDKVVTKELYGYKYSFPSQVSHSGLGKGSVFKCNGCSVFAYKLNDLSFTSWDTVINDCQSIVFDEIYSAFRFYPESQEVKSSEKVTNDNGEELYRVCGIFKTSDGEKDFIAYYHLTDDSKVRFFIGISENNSKSISETVDFVANNLAKSK